ncbi:MAG: molybdopterin-synthase adenylyltransferase MoeB [Gammaproteobacteria bacterium]|nr:molybdopterin-synthase adenylyltransferase MoeB [Gammaproteobacteria bacterium]
MNDQQLLRYSRQIMLPQLDVEGQQCLLQSHALIIGMGGLGSPVALYLAAAGVGRLTLADFDTVDLSNLQRQILHGQADIGRPKVESAADSLRALNPDIELHTINHKLDGLALLEAVDRADVVLDASDNFTTRFDINHACVQTRTPLVSGAAVRLEGQVSVFPNQDDDSPCYRCLYDDQPEEESAGSWAGCSATGVLAPVVGIIGSIQATEAIKVLSGLGTTLAGRLLVLDAASLEFRSMRLPRDPHCPVCGNGLAP